MCPWLLAPSWTEVSRAPNPRTWEAAPLCLKLHKLHKLLFCLVLLQ